jgi:hypothetical protein
MVSFILASAFQVAAPRPAAALGCPDVEEQIFRTGYGGEYGTTNRFATTNRDVNPNCIAYTPAWSAAHVLLGGVFGNFVESGIRGDVGPF